jgi:hypothetical protein
VWWSGLTNWLQAWTVGRRSVDRREREIMALAVTGLSAKDIAAQGNQALQSRKQEPLALGNPMVGTMWSEPGDAI